MNEPPGSLALFTDLYELTMGQAYFDRDMDTPATFEMFVRRLPRARNFLVAAGLEQVLGYLETFRFGSEEIAYLRSLGRFSEPYLEHLAAMRFGGDVHAMREGTVFFAGEPIIRVTAPRIQAQLVETFLLNAINFQSMIAAKAARITLAAAGRPYVDFSGRRDHSFDAAILAARASYIAGAAGTSSVEAGRRFGIPVSGTMAHSYVMSFANEVEAFTAFMRSFPAENTLLIDTYDTVRGARYAVEAARLVADTGASPAAVRIDSGDFDADSRAVRTVLDEAGLRETRIFVSGDLDEFAIAQLIAGGAPVDAFGVGTRLGVSADAPYLPGVYKLVEDGSGGHFKLSPGKETLPHDKQVWRRFESGLMAGDTVGFTEESGHEGAPLLEHVMRNGERVAAPEALADMRERCLASLASLPRGLRAIEGEAEPYAVSLSAALAEKRESLLEDYSERAG